MNDVALARKLAPVSQPISPAKFAHFVLRTGQLNTMAVWYETVLNARIVFRDEPWQQYLKDHPDSVPTDVPPPQKN